MATLTQERRLTGAAPKQIMQRFEALDAQTGEVMEKLRNTNSQRAFIWAHRDGLYPSQLAWQGVLEEWDGAGMAFTEVTRALLLRTCRFLAPRFMSLAGRISATVTERKNLPVRQMVW
ncbi:MAG TPA: hypothetical protein VK726_22690 [Acetobacteraceae bacterium]|jgi:hypothetical protein|nr:hypothetical protein [Acetobacteraceae bacterium]